MIFGFFSEQGSPDLVSSSLTLHGFANPRRRRSSTADVRASFVTPYVEERLGPFCFTCVDVYSFTSLKFPPEHGTVHFTKIDYPLEIAFIHATSIRGKSPSSNSCILRVLRQLASWLDVHAPILPQRLRAISARLYPRINIPSSS